MNDVSELLRMVTAPGTNTEAARALTESFTGDRAELLKSVRNSKEEMRARGVPGDTADHIFEGDYLEAVHSVIEDDRVYKALCDAERIIDPEARDDVDLRSVTQLYLELVDVIVVDLREACTECRRYPEKEHLASIHACLSGIEALLKAGADQLSLYSTESPATLRSKGAKAIARCREHITSVTHGAALDLPELDEALEGLCDAFWKVCDRKDLAELQERRNENWRADHKWIHDWLTRKVMEMNGQVEDLDLTDMTQRRYLAQLISISQDVLNDYNSDH